ncbi:MAG: helicase associated domain-containing protein [Verrucomicrobia bacterium]|nr:helicase associated domain-containing protein [Verrucomicrobiota bacterium]
MGRPNRLIRPGVETVALCSNRIARNLPELTTDEMEQLRMLMRRVFAYAEIDMLAYAVTPTGYQALLRTPKPRRLSDEELLERAAILYEPSPKQLQTLKRGLARHPVKSPEGRRLRLSHQRIIHHLSPTISILQTRFSKVCMADRPHLYKHWADRFKSLPVEDRREVIAKAAAMVDATPRWMEAPCDPEHYQFCTFGEAVAGNRDLRRQLAATTGSGNWTAARKAHRVAVAAVERPKRSRNMPQAVGNVPVAKLSVAAARRGTRRIEPRPPAEWISLLRSYKKRHGHCDPSVTDPEFLPLARWLFKMRHRKAIGTIAPDLERKLTSLGVTWGKRKRGARPGASPLQDRRWKAHYQKLLEFKAEHSHTKVPKSYGDDKAFTSWVWRQRSAKRRGQLEPQRKKLLDAVGFQWELRSKKRGPR